MNSSGKSSQGVSHRQQGVSRQESSPTSSAPARLRVIVYVITPLGASLRETARFNRDWIRHIGELMDTIEAPTGGQLQAMRQPPRVWAERVRMWDESLPPRVYRTMDSYEDYVTVLRAARVDGALRMPLFYIPPERFDEMPRIWSWPPEEHDMILTRSRFDVMRAYNERLAVNKGFGLLLPEPSEAGELKDFLDTLVQVRLPREPYLMQAMD